MVYIVLSSGLTPQEITSISLLNIDKCSTSSEMFVYLNIPGFGELLRSGIHSFTDRIKNCKNNLILSSIMTSST